MTPLSDDLAIIEEQAADWLLVLGEQQISPHDSTQYPQPLNVWLAENSQHSDVFNKMLELWTLSAHLDDDYVTQQLAQLDAQNTTAVTDIKPQSKRRAQPWYLAIAATLLLVGLVTFMAPEQPLQQAPVASAKPAPVDTVYSEFFQTKVNEHRTITLDDNSQVDLGANSQLAVRYSNTSRELLLYQGEALFSVSKDKQRPFIVRYQNSQVEALGTVFNVRANPASIRVDVLEGRVAVTQQQAIKLTQGQAVEVTQQGDVTRSKAQGEALTMAWQKGYLVYQNAELGNVLNDVSRYSEIKVKLSDQRLAKLTYNGTFLTTEISDWLNSLEKIYPITVMQKGEEYTLIAN